MSVQMGIEQEKDVRGEKGKTNERSSKGSVNRERGERRKSAKIKDENVLGKEENTRRKNEVETCEQRRGNRRKSADVKEEKV